MAVIDTSIRKEARDRYLTYALSVVSGRALPDVRDGLKPVQRRILYAMLQNLKLRPDGSHRKSAAVIGEVLARFHPHGDVACYDALVRMAQDFSLRYPLIDGQGNFGSMDGDGAAAYRYTEAKLRPLAIEVIGEIGDETVLFRENFDATTQEPEVLPSRVPNLLINGASGIAVGMATNIPPHNLRDTIKALVALSENPELTNSNLCTHIKGPDFPTGCLILNGKRELNEIYKTGKGSIRMRGEWKLEEGARKKRYIVVTSIPYTVNKASLIEKIANLIIEKKIPQLADVRDESTTDVRIVLELTSGSDPETAMTYLYKNTQLESNFAVNLTALVPVGEGQLKPELLSLKDCLQHFLDFRFEVTQRKLEYEKKQLQVRIHILEGLVKIFDKLDEAIRIVRNSNGRSDAAEKLRKKFKLSEVQSFAVVDMRIYQLSKTNIEEVRAELDAKKKRVREINAILKSPEKISKMVRDELQEIAEVHGDRRLCKITDYVEEEFDETAYVVEEDVYAIVTADGWIKRIRQTNDYTSTRVREGDTILRAHPVSTLDGIAFITTHGYLYQIPVKDFPSSSGYGDPVQKILKFRDGERIAESFAVPGPDSAMMERETIYPFALCDEDQLLLVSKSGTGAAIVVDELFSIKRNGKRVMKLRAGDELAAACLLAGEVAFFTRKGSGLVIKQSEIPVRTSASIGVALMGVRKQDELVSVVSFDKDLTLEMNLGGGKTKPLESKTIVRGRRSLKGNKVLARGELVSVSKVVDE